MNQNTVGELYEKLDAYWAAKEFSGTSLELAIFTVFACNYYLVESGTYIDETLIDYKKIINLILQIENKELSEEKIYEISTYMVHSKIVRGALFTLYDDLKNESEREMLPRIRTCINTALRESYGYFYSQVNNLKPDFYFYPQNKEISSSKENQPLFINGEFLTYHCSSISKKLGINLNSIVFKFYFKDSISSNCSGSFGYNSTSEGWNLSFYLYPGASQKEVLNILSHELKHAEQRFSGRKYRRFNGLEDYDGYDSSEVEIEAREFADEYVSEQEQLFDLDTPFFIAKE